MAIERFANAPIPSSPSTAWTTLSAGIDASTTTIPVVGFAAFPSTVQFRIRIDNEYLLVTGGAGTATWTATRGIEGSTAAVHASGASVFHVLTAAGLANHPRSMMTAGDLEYLSAAFAPTRLGIGSAGQVLTVAGGLPTWATPAAGGVTSVALSVPSFLSVTGSPVTTAGTLAVSLATQSANLVFAGPTTGVAAAPTFRSLVAGDVPDISASYLTPAAAAAAYQPLGSYAAASHTHTASQVTDLATATVAFSNKTGAISQWTNDTGYLTGASADALFTTPAEVTTALGAYLPLAGGTLTGPITGTSNTVELRNGTGTAAQVLRGRYAYTDGANHQGWSIIPSASAITLAAETAGTGADNIDIALTPAGTGGVRLTKVKDAGDAEYTFVSGVLRVPSAMLVTAGAGYFGIDGSTHFFAPSDGKLALLNWAESGFTALQFGGTTSSFPSLKRSTTALQARLADDSDYAPFAAKSYNVNGTAGASFGPGAVASITVVNGIVTAIS